MAAPPPTERSVEDLTAELQRRIQGVIDRVRGASPATAPPTPAEQVAAQAPAAPVAPAATMADARTRAARAALHEEGG